MVSLGDAVAVLVPAATPLVHYHAEGPCTDANGQPQAERVVYYPAWDAAGLGMKPTAAQLAAVTQAQVDAARLAASASAAKSAMTTNDPTVKITRNTFRVILGAIAARDQFIDLLLAKVNELATAAGKATITTTRPPTRTWPQLMAAVRAATDAEADPTV